MIDLRLRAAYADHDRGATTQPYLEISDCLAGSTRCRMPHARDDLITRSGHTNLFCCSDLDVTVDLPAEQRLIGVEFQTYCAGDGWSCVRYVSTRTYYCCISLGPRDWLFVGGFWLVSTTIVVVWWIGLLGDLVLLQTV